MKRCQMNYKRFMTYKKIRAVLGVITGISMILSAFVFGYNGNLTALFVLLVCGIILAILSKTRNIC